MPKPKGDLGTLMISKGTAAAARPFQAVTLLPATPAPAAGQELAGQEVRPGLQVTLISAQASASSATRAMTLKIPEDIYWRLHELCGARGRAQGRRVTHQEVMREGLMALLDREQP